jgi:hypothetical protein
MGKQSDYGKLLGAGFSEMEEVEISRLMFSTSGMEKEGKTHFAFTGPGPIAVISTDTGTLATAQKFIKTGKVIYPCYLKVDKNAKKAEWDKEWTKAANAFDAVVESDKIRSLVVDTGSGIWDLLRLHLFGKLTQVMPHHYTEANAEMRQLVRRVYDNRLDLVSTWIHKVKKEYRSDKKGEKDMWTGAYEFAGWKDFGYEADANILSFRRNDNEFVARVKDCRHEPTLNGMEFAGEENNIPYLASLMLPDIDPATWED